MENSNKSGLYITLSVGLIFIVFLGLYFLTDVFKKSQIIEEELQYYTNERGEKWTLPDGKYDFTVSAAGFPKFLSGSIDPLKVQVGDTQKMTISVASPIPIKTVIATIDTDKGTRDVPLLLKESKSLSGDSIRNQKYLINEDGELIINNTNAGYAEKAIENLIEKAEAQSVMEYIYEGEWIVQDTHTKTYHTKFIVEDEEGNKGKMTMAWSDPVCNFFEEDGIAKLQASCNPEGGAEGVDGLDMSLNGNTITLNGDTKLYWNGSLGVGDDGQQKAINIGDGSILLNGTSGIQEDLLYYLDEDEDTWTGSQEFAFCEEACLPMIRAKDSPSRPWRSDLPNIHLDCSDTNANAHPQQTSYFDSPDCTGETCTFDYDCNGSIDGGWAADLGEGSVSSVNSVVARENPPGECDQAEAFSFALDGCGSDSVTAGDCNTDGVSACDSGIGYRPQEDDGNTQNAWFDTSLQCLATTVKTFCH